MFTGGHALQVYRSEKTREGREEEEEDEEEAPAPMTTRLRKRAERRREKATEQEREQERPIAETISISDEAEEDRCPSHWDVEQVFSYIKSLPGDAVILIHLPLPSTDFQHHLTPQNLTGISR